MKESLKAAGIRANRKKRKEVVQFQLPSSEKEPLKWNCLISMKKNLAEAAFEQRKTILRWIIDT
jgi:hypothetical protein